MTVQITRIDYSWGTLVTAAVVELGCPVYTLTFFPDMQAQLAALEEGETTTIEAETGERIHATRTGDTLRLRPPVHVYAKALVVYRSSLVA